MTVWMNRIDAKLRASLDAPVFQTWNPLPSQEPAKGSVIADYSFDRPVVTEASTRSYTQRRKS